MVFLHTLLVNSFSKPALLPVNWFLDQRVNIDWIRSIVRSSALLLFNANLSLAIVIAQMKAWWEMFFLHGILKKKKLLVGLLAKYY